MIAFKGYLVLVTLTAAITTYALAAEDSEITKFMKFMEVIPDVLDEGPKDFLKITYDSGVFADKGVELTPTQVKNQPTIEWKSEPDAFYTLIMCDPDAPSRAEPKFREFAHWIVGNVPGGDLAKGDVIIEYIGSGPPKDTGLHRYVLLVYKQAKKLTFDEPHLSKTEAKGRGNFATKQFAKKYELGVPLAGNFFQAQYDDYVPVLHQQLGFTA